MFACQTAPPPKGGAAGIRDGEVTRRDFASSLPFIGRVESSKAVALVALGSGRVAKVVARDGSAMKRGEPLFVMGGPLLGQELSAASVEEKIARERLALARGVLSRKKASNESKLVDLNELASARAAVAQCSADLAAASSRLNELHAQEVYRAPVSGVFTDRRVNVGQDVEIGQPLGEIESPGSLRVAALIYGDNGAKLNGLPAKIDAGNKEAEAVVVQTFPERSPAGGITVWLEGAGLAGEFGPGESVQGRLIMASHDGALAVPRSAVVYDEAEKPWVFVAAKSGYVKTEVVLGLSDPEWVEIVKGLEAGQRIAVEGAYSLYYEDFAKTHAVED